MKKALALILACVMVFSLGACKNNEGSAVGNSDFKFKSYPIDTDEKLTYWMSLPSNAVSVVTNMGETPWGKKFQENVGVEIEFIHPAAGQGSQAFGLMIASDTMTDIIEYSWVTEPGGPAKAIADETIIPLNDYMDEAPNLKAALAKNEIYERSAKTDEGDYYMFPFIRDDIKLVLSAGPIVRKDWLDELGFEIPTTIEEWEVVLTAFKEKKGATAPFTVNQPSQLLSFFDASQGFYVENGTVKYGPTQPFYKKAIESLNDWFKKGLIDPNYMSSDKKQLDSNMLTGKSGLAMASGGSGLGQWLAAKPEGSFDLAGAIYPLEDGRKTRTFTGGGQHFQAKGAAISTSCKNVPLAMRVLDYAYSEEGHMLFNFGIEGESYTMVDGEPKYTDVINKNPDGYTPAQAMALYHRAAGNGPFLQDKGYIEGYYSTPQQAQALDAWMVNLENAQKHLIPTATFPTIEESSESATILNEISTYVSEMTVKFITGVEPISNYDAFLKRLDQLNIKRAIELEQAAYDRYLKR